MKFSKLFKEFILKDEVPMLVFLEHDGAEAMLHFIVWPKDLGTVDLKMTAEDDVIARMFLNMDDEKAQSVFDTQMRGMLDAFEGKEDQPGG